MSFNVTGVAYDRFMGRYSQPLAVVFSDAVGVATGQRVLDVGCGPGALTSEIVARVGADHVAAVDPSPTFVEAFRARLPDVEVHRAGAEALPFDDEQFDVVLCQLVVHFMTDPVAGLREMARVARRGGTVAACVWDLAGGAGPLSTYQSAVRSLDPEAPDEADLAGGREGQLAQIFTDAGLRDAETSVITVSVRHETFEDWWEPYLLGVGPAGAYVAGLDEAGRERLRRRCIELLPPAPFEQRASAWCTRART